MQTSRVPFGERGGALRGMLDLVSGRFPAFVFGGGVDVLPVFHFHDVTRDELEPKLQYLAENRYRTVTADEIAACVAGRVPLDGRHVALCFDDAWASLWTIAAPLLERHGLTAITYAIPARIADAPRCRARLEDPGGPDPPADAPFVTWPELRALHASGLVDVQCHTDSHSMVFCSDAIRDFVTPRFAATPLLNRPQVSPAPNLQFLTPAELGAPLYLARSRMSDARRVAVSRELGARCVEYVRSEGGASFFERPDWRTRLTRVASTPAATSLETESDQERAISDELDRGRATLRARLRTESVNHLCLPWGVAGRRTSVLLRRLGYRTAIANRLRGVLAVRPGDDPYWLKRLPNRYIFHLPGRGRRYGPRPAA